MRACRVKSCPANLPPSKHASAAQFGRRFVLCGSDGSSSAVHHAATLEFFEFAATAIFPAVDDDGRRKVQARIVVPAPQRLDVDVIAMFGDCGIGNQFIGVHRITPDVGLSGVKPVRNTLAE
jgi:hypothetical protein